MSQPSTQPKSECWVRWENDPSPVGTAQFSPRTQTLSRAGTPLFTPLFLIFPATFCPRGVGNLDFSAASFSRAITTAGSIGPGSSRNAGDPAFFENLERSFINGCLKGRSLTAGAITGPYETWEALARLRELSVFSRSMLHFF